MALTRLGGANAITGVIPLANGGTGATSFTEGIKGFDSWRLTADVAGTDADVTLTSNLARNNDSYFSKIGTGMSESSGVFSFPQTGLYLVQFFCRIRFDTSGDNCFVRIELTSDNGSSFTNESFTLVSGATNEQESGFGQVAFNVTDTSTHKTKFTVGSLNTNNDIIGSADANQTYFNFIRIGD
tara:strand:+ start:409 stop:960 length:552 start_codon:yes stop_codon:yes gene_type:complete